MVMRRKWIVGLFSLLLAAGLAVGTMWPLCAGAVGTDHPSDTPAYGRPGGQPVGSRALIMGEASGLALSIWYPAVRGGEGGAAVAYPYQIKLPAAGAVTIATDVGYAVPEAAADLSSGPFPLVILSPGFAMSGSSYGWLAEHLASHGFVVLALEHDEAMNPESGLWRAAVRRPREIQAVFAYLEAAVRPGGALAGLVDPEAVAVMGHSYGGYTALAAAGARLDSAGFARHCEEAARDRHPAAWLCDMLLPHLPEMAAAAGLDGLPEGLWPDWSEPRVDAVVSLAGDAFFFGAAGMAELEVPVLAIGGTADRDSPYAWGTRPTYDYAASARKAVVALTEAEHMIFTNGCGCVPLYARPVAGEFCADAVWDRQRAHDWIGHFTTAFLLAELKQDVRAAAALAPEAAAFSLITYAAEGY